MFASNLDGSFVAHQYIVAAYSSKAVDFPLTMWGCEGGKTDTVTTLTKRRAIGRSIRACFDNPTIASEADAAGISWRFYADQLHGFGGFWSSYQADKQIYNGPDWRADVISPPSQFLTDLAGGNLATITWIAPLWPELRSSRRYGQGRPGMGCQPGERNRRRARSGTRRRSSSSGTTGADSSTPCSRHTKITTDWASAFRSSWSPRTPSAIR